MEIQASAVEVVGWVDDRKPTPSPEAPQIFEYLRAGSPASAHQYHWRDYPGAHHPGQCHPPQLFSRPRLCWINTPLSPAAVRRAPGNCSGQYPGYRQSARAPAGAVDYSQDFGGSRFSRSQASSVESYCLAMSKVYTFGPRSGRKLQYQPPSGGVLDGGAGNRLCRPQRRRRPGGGPAQYVFTRVLEEQEDDMAFSRSISTRR